MEHSKQYKKEFVEWYKAYKPEEYKKLIIYVVLRIADSAIEKHGKAIIPKGIDWVIEDIRAKYDIKEQ